MLKLSELQIPAGSRKNRKRVGRGVGSGTGKTCGKGHKGQKSRSGGKPHPWFEGGQMPLQRRLPKRGFHNLFRKVYEIVNLGQLDGIDSDQPVTPELLKEKGLVKKVKAVKILAEGEFKTSLTIHAHKFSQSAIKKIASTGGKAVVL